jgi:hypothetical protein
MQPYGPWTQKKRVRDKNFSFTAKLINSLIKIGIRLTVIASLRFIFEKIVVSHNMESLSHK